MSEDDFGFCRRAALLVDGDGRAIVSRDDGVSFLISVKNNKLESYKRLDGEYVILSTRHIPDTEEELLEWYRSVTGVELARADGKPISLKDIDNLRVMVNEFYLKCIREQGDLTLH